MKLWFLRHVEIDLPHNTSIPFLYVFQRSLYSTVVETCSSMFIAVHACSYPQSLAHGNSLDIHQLMSRWRKCGTMEFYSAVKINYICRLTEVTVKHDTGWGTTVQERLMWDPPAQCIAPSSIIKASCWVPAWFLNALCLRMWCFQQ